MMESRLKAGHELLQKNGAVFSSIDDNEVKNLWDLMSIVFDKENYLSSFVWKRRSASGMSGIPMSLDHEYVISFAKDKSEVALEGLEKNLDSYPYFDEQKKMHYASTDLTIGATKDERPNQYYEITNPRTGVSYQASEQRVWRFFPETMREVIANDLVIWPDEQDGNLTRPRYKTYFDPENRKANPLSSWIENSKINDKDVQKEESEYMTSILSSGMNSEGGRVLSKIMGSKSVSYPKPLSLIRSFVRSSTGEGQTCLDFFAGSGTTGQAIISLNREDKKKRKFILVEMGSYFDYVLKPRVQKSCYTENWQDGNPIFNSKNELHGLSQCFKVIRLESYEDALGNLALNRQKGQQTLLGSEDKSVYSEARQNYVMNYMLEVETRGSQSLLNTQQFLDPNRYELKVRSASGDETKTVHVDLLETFNYLLGLRVEHIAAPIHFDADVTQSEFGRWQAKVKRNPEGAWWFRTVFGTNANGQKVLVVWRNLPSVIAGEDAGLQRDNAVLDAVLIEKLAIRLTESQDDEIDLLYVNGDHNIAIPRNRKGEPMEQARLQLIEEAFHRLMFAGTDSVQ